MAWSFFPNCSNALFLTTSFWPTNLNLNTFSAQGDPDDPEVWAGQKGDGSRMDNDRIRWATLLVYLCQKIMQEWRILNSETPMSHVWFREEDSEQLDLRKCQFAKAWFSERWSKIHWTYRHFMHKHPQHPGGRCPMGTAQTAKERFAFAVRKPSQTGRGCFDVQFGVANGNVLRKFWIDVCLVWAAWRRAEGVEKYIEGSLRFGQF